MRTATIERLGGSPDGVAISHGPNIRNGIQYRKDIDGLRAVAVVAVIAFHLGLAPMGYLGVDVFFVISGYLITGIVIREIDSGTFSFAEFYQRRARRIIPLSLTVSLVALAAGLLLMLPDDLENLSQSVIATNLFANNILQAITTRNYWDVVNEYKPLMHTWSLGIEEQFYIIWPVALLMTFRAGRKWRLPVLSVICAGSFILFLFPFREYVKFYHLPFRLFELASGGLVAVAQQQVTTRSRWAGGTGLIALFAILVSGNALPSEASVILTVGAACLMMAAGAGREGWYARILENRVLVYIGLISFSLYMWHQVVFAFARYAFVEELTGNAALMAVVLTLALSVISYNYVERFFRDRKRVSLAAFNTIIGALFFAVTTGALWVYWGGGAVRDVPELDLKAGAGGRGIHARYNGRVHELDRDFSTASTKVLVIGNSFARDWVNVLLASDWAGRIEISYSSELPRRPDALARAEEADLIFWSEALPEQVSQLNAPLREKLYVVGTKNFGRSAGIFYNHRGEDYFRQRVEPDEEWLHLNHVLLAAYGDRYVDQMSPLLDAGNKVPVFTPDGKFISQDCRHLTPAGAAYIGKILEPRLDVIFTTIGTGRPERHG